jgi:hypothetical protein
MKNLKLKEQFNQMLQMQQQKAIKQKEQVQTTEFDSAIINQSVEYASKQLIPKKSDSNSSRFSNKQSANKSFNSATVKSHKQQTVDQIYGV